MVDQHTDDGSGSEPTPPSAAPPPRPSWSAPGADPVEPDAVTTELPRGTYPAGEPSWAPPATPGALPAGSPFGEGRPGAWTAPSGVSAVGPASPPFAAPGPVEPASGPSPAGRGAPIPQGWAPPRPPAPGIAPGPGPGPGPAPGPGAHAAPPAAPPGYPVPTAPPGWAPTAPTGWAPAAPSAAAWTPASNPYAPSRPADSPEPWWNRDAAGTRIPATPPEYDPARFGALGASGGVPPLLPPGVGAGGSEPVRRGRGSTVRSAVLVGVLSAVIASLITGGLFVAFTDGPPVAAGTDRGPTPTLVPSLDIYDLLERAQPSVVSIRTDISSSSGTTPFGAGSGVIISEDGLVLTNNHVIAGSSTMRVTIYDGTEHEATLVGSFPDDDIALIRMAAPDALTPAVLGSSADMVVGDPVVAIGNALNLGGPPSVTEGIVSAKDRNIQTADGTLRNLIQTDAAINPGNSGGPLLNAQGQVVGINTAIIDDAQNIGFAISIDQLKPLIEDLKEGRGDITPESPFLGVSTQTVTDVTDAVLERYGVTTDAGAFVSDVVPGSGAADAGLQPGDVIVGIDGQEVTSSTDVGEIIHNREAGEMITIEIERQGETLTLTATLKRRSETGN